MPSTVVNAAVLSVAFMETVNVPEEIGVPEMIPDESILIPLGRFPLTMLKVTGAVPPAEVAVAEKLVPTIPLKVKLEVGEVIVKGAGRTVRL